MREFHLSYFLFGYLYFLFGNIQINMIGSHLEVREENPVTIESFSNIPLEMMNIIKSKTDEREVR